MTKEFKTTKRYNYFVALNKQKKWFWQPKKKHLIRDPANNLVFWSFDHNETCRIYTMLCKAFNDGAYYAGLDYQQEMTQTCLGAIHDR